VIALSEELYRTTKIVGRPISEIRAALAAPTARQRQRS
jgi:hypothetical protein